MRTRFAPSPTGPLHFGSVRTALFAWLAARHAGGAFILRIEDTDQERYIPGVEALIIETLRWLGLEWDEGPETGGPHGPYMQSERTELYRTHAADLVRGGAAYWCTCTPERLAAMRDEQRARHEPTRYDRRCLGRQDEVERERRAGTAAVLRLLMPPGTTEWDDIVRGRVSFDNAEIDDQVLLKSDGFPTYHLAVVVDDHLMDVTHVIRADEWIPSTPKHLALYTALRWDPPRFAHVPPVLDTDGHKLSKRRGARNVLEYGELGYVPSAVVNAMALLGWSSGTDEEVFTPDDLCRRFTLERIHPAPAVFDPKRLDDLNGVHIRRMDVEELVEALEFHLPGTSKDTRRRLVPLLRERIVTLADATRLAEPLLGEPVRDDSIEFPPKGVSDDVAGALLDACIAAVEAGGLDDLEQLRETLRHDVDERGVKARVAFRVLFIAVLGSPVGLPVFDSMAFLGQETTLARLRTARTRLLRSSRNGA
ncbi:MAG: glutamate--tRNA ligase [Candidatus Dormibacteraeota bacterium]|nr:glutamate--tRNA ligase [Candidatus Dormibacteraeota bacterium]MBV9526485.1 glutamate--tRNA ligase [Candidatus Dormibacteraeota bacterium]